MDADLCIKIRVQRGWPTAGGEGELLPIQLNICPFNSFLTPLYLLFNSR